MRILWSIHLYPPHHNCGSEAVAHAINKYLLKQGHHVRVILHQAKMHNIDTPYMWEGVEVFAPPSVRQENCLDAYRWADVILTHLDFTAYTIQMGHLVKRPVINFIHNSHRYSSVETAFANNFVVYNSNWIKEKLNYNWPSMVFTPPCDWKHYDVCEDPSKNECITLIGLDENKGGNLLQEIAAAMPDRKFIGVVGSYSEPAKLGQFKDQPSNVEVVPNTPDILGVYRKTRILLMPSRYESWGRTATEAMCSGIPVICTPTPGLKENCADAGIYVPMRKQYQYDDMGIRIEDGEPDNYNVKDIIKQIKKLDNPVFYKAVSEKCRARSRELDPVFSLNQLENFITDAVYQRIPA